ncbi:radical SAM/SPASM domain-containing protein [Flagellimonas meridianipacifica]|uniref:Radical SAM core domain-containing protein n=1 Tax=Flagellimonas meridianipacifica TaxID=1080225 RepID=A0A2T0MFP6_9FLAO|nr:radical SAM protein [Allomuricauda pacifica]PRX56385.1 uncharacterized protein CLV81_0382 [Allomuricauda pacifica]
MIKSSFYNVLIPIVESDEYILYNTKNGGLELLTYSNGIELERYHDITSIDLKSEGRNLPMLEYLYSKGYFLDADIDEREEFHSFYSKERRDTTIKSPGTINLTIGTTILCNMGCPYCFEFVKPNLTLKSEENIVGIAKYVNDMIVKSPVKSWKTLNVTWYGGEPLINTFGIEKLTPLLLELCEKYGMDYNSDIITNGLLLDLKTWNFLIENKVQNVQVTIDGSKETHNKSRPLKGKNTDTRKNYERILENLSIMPTGIKTNIRINVDRKVASSFAEFFEDMESYGIWPMRFSEFNFSPSWLRVYEEAGDYDSSEGLSNPEFFDVLQDFRALKIKLFNKWATKNNIPQAKLKWTLPSKQQDCATWVSPYSMVIDPLGYIHKCWETIHDKKRSVNHVNSGYSFDDFKEYFDFDRFQLHQDCYECKYLPVCDQLSCSHQAIETGKPPCTYWKERTIPFVKEQYLMLKNHPDLISAPINQKFENTGHTNK